MSEEVPEGEEYWDKAKETMRRRRGPRRSIRRGPYSAEECDAIEAFDKWITTERAMHGALSQTTCTDMTAFIARSRLVCARYSYENWPDVRGLNPHVIFEEMDIQPYDPSAPVREPPEDLDIFKDLR